MKASTFEPRRFTNGSSTEKEAIMKPRVDSNMATQAAPDAMKAPMARESAIQKSGLEQSLMALMNTRASRINGCAFCIHMHTGHARAHGEIGERP